MESKFWFPKTSKHITRSFGSSGAQGPASAWISCHCLLLCACSSVDRFGDDNTKLNRKRSRSACSNSASEAKAQGEVAEPGMSFCG